MNIIYKIKNWIFYMRNLYGFNNIKSVLLYTNIIFIITIILILRYKKNIKNNRIKNYVSLLLLFIMSIISCKYHDCQCYSNKKNIILKWQKVDILVSLIITFYFFILYFKNINLYILLLSGFSIVLWAAPPLNNNNNLYVLCHSLWHILVGVICYLLIIND